MSVREYIGARYVPVFSDPIQWDNTNSYEPLTVVTNLGTSYVSKQSVPEGVDITNETYWLRWADYNAQLEEYIRQVQLYDERISAVEDALPVTDFDSTNTVEAGFESIDARFDTIEADSWVTENRLANSAVTTNKVADDSITPAKLYDKKPYANNIVIIGDSYGAGWTPDGDVVGWPQLVAQWMDDYGIETYHKSAGGVGFGAGSSYITPLQELTATLTDAQKESVSTVVICGGANDRGATSANITTGMAQVKTYIENNYPNVSRVLIGFVGMYVEGKTTGVWANATFAQLTTAERNYAIGCKQSQLGTLIPYGLSVLRSDSYFSSDWVHPKLEGQQEICKYVVSALMGLPLANTAITYVDSKIGVGITNGHVNFYIVPNINYNVTISSFTFNGGYSNLMQLGTYTRNAALQVNNYLAIPCTAIIAGKETSSSTTTKYYEVPGFVRYDNSGNVKFNGMKVNSDHSNYLTLYNITHIELLPAFSDFSLNACMDMH